MEEGKKLDVEFKQTVNGSWYVGSLKVGADSVEELDKFIDSTVTFLHTKVDNMNLKMVSKDFKPASPPVIDYNGQRIIHYPTGADFPSHGGTANINAAHPKIELPFKKKEGT